MFLISLFKSLLLSIFVWDGLVFYHLKDNAMRQGKQIHQGYSFFWGVFLLLVMSAAISIHAEAPSYKGACTFQRYFEEWYHCAAVSEEKWHIRY